MGNRYNSTNEIGVCILKLRFLKDTGWIPRSILEEDMGIDVDVEQVINGNPTAHYISVQLKTGLGNVHLDKDGNYIYYIDNVHYDYWLSSPIPVIIALCDPNTEIIYWELIKKYNISKTNTQFKITIPKEHVLDKTSTEELSTIIETYQTDFELPGSYEDDFFDLEYLEDLLVNCSQALSNSTILFNQLDAKYGAINQQMTNFIDLHTNGIGHQEAKTAIKKYSKKFKLAIDICKTQFRSQIPIIIKTHIESVRLIGKAIDGSNIFITDDISKYIADNFIKELNSIDSVIKTFSLGAKKYKDSTSSYVELQRSEFSFSMILEEYVTELKELSTIIKQLINKLNN